MTSLQNYTIDDAQWATQPLHLTPGWNMLRVNGSDQYINKPQVDEMTPLLGNFWNDSVSWTTDAGASTTIVFEGTDIWAYGMAGPNQGPYIAAVDNQTVGQFTAFANDSDYHYLLYAAHDLDPGKTHTLTLTNGQNGSSLAFDVALVTPAPSNSTLPQNTSSATSPDPSDAAANATDAASAEGAPSMEQIIAAEEQKLAMEWDPTKLAQLAIPYKFHWSPSAYFVVVATAFVGALTFVVVIMFLLRAWNARRRKLRAEKNGTSYLKHRKPRPTTRIIEALRRGKISHPMPSEDGGSEYSGKKAGSDGGAHEEAVQHGW